MEQPDTSDGQTLRLTAVNLSFCNDSLLSIIRTGDGFSANTKGQNQGFELNSNFRLHQITTKVAVIL